MFQKKQLIYSDSLGMCRVDNIVNLAATKGAETTQYYVLKPLNDPDKSSYIPVENHQMVLREMFTVEEALELKDKEETKKDSLLMEAITYVLKEEEN